MGEGSVVDAPDFRLVALGSLLPDLVDKTAGRRLYRDDLGYNEHTYGHTLLFSLGLFGLALATERRRRARLLSLASGAGTHLLLDPVMRSPRTLLWPALGTQFPRVNGLGRRTTLATQVAAGTVLLSVLARLIAHRKLGRFLATGAL